MDSGEFVDWLAYWEREPCGPRQENLRAGLVCSLLFNGQKSPTEPAARPEDFFPSLRAAPRRTFDSPEDQVLLARMYAVAFGGTDG